MKLYKIADFIFGVHMDESLDIPENFKKFEISSSPEDIQTEYFIKIVDELPEPQGECITTRNDLQVFQNGNIESRRMNFVGIPEPYGVYEEKHIVPGLYYGRDVQCKSVCAYRLRYACEQNTENC